MALRVWASHGIQAARVPWTWKDCFIRNMEAAQSTGETSRRWTASSSLRTDPAYGNNAHGTLVFNPLGLHPSCSGRCDSVIAEGDIHSSLPTFAIPNEQAFFPRPDYRTHPYRMRNRIICDFIRYNPYHHGHTGSASRHTPSPTAIHRNALDLALVPHLEPVRERPHVGVLVFQEFEAVRHDAHRPAHDPRRPIGLEAQPEVACMLIVDAERVARTVGIGVHVGGEPFLCTSQLANIPRTERAHERRTQLSLRALLELFALHQLRDLLGHRLHVVDDQLVEISVRVLAANSE